MLINIFGNVPTIHGSTFFQNWLALVPWFNIFLQQNPKPSGFFF
jgi:hypothetical protein